MRLPVTKRHAALEVLGEDDAVVAEGLSKAFHDLTERVFEAPTPVLTRAFKGRRPTGLVEETLQEDDDDFDDTDLDDDEPVEAGPELEEASGLVWALRNVSFRIPKGTAVALVGGSNSGKTTLLRILAGALPPTTGTAVLAGHPSPSISMAAELIVQTSSPARNIATAGKLIGMRKRTTRPYVDRIVTLAEIPAGDQRVGVTRAPYKLAVATAIELGAILLLDEPFATAAPSFRARLIDAIERRKAEGATILLATRDRETMRRLCDSAIWLHHGTVARIGEVDEVLAAYDASAAAEASTEPHPNPGPGFNETAAIVSAKGEGEPDGRVTIRLDLELSRAAVTLQNSIGLIRNDGMGLWMEQPDPVVCKQPGFHRFQLVAHDVPPGHYTGLIQTRVLEEGTEAVLARRDAFELTVGDPGGATSAGKTRWQRWEASWLHETAAREELV